MDSRGMSGGAHFPYTPKIFSLIRFRRAVNSRSMGDPSDKDQVEGSSRKADPGRWVDDHGEILYRFALTRVRRPEVAEDLVQDTLMAAVRSVEGFSGRASERNWLFGILKNKIADHFRKLGRETSFTDLKFLDDELSHKFEEGGFWNHELGPVEWQKTEAVVYREEFWAVMRACLGKLPPRVADVFPMREMDDADTESICGSLGISRNNLWVMLHRARMALRECLEMNWFGRATV